MSLKSQIAGFKVIAKSMGIRILESKGTFTTNYCKIDNEMVIVINKNRGIRARLAGLAKIFATLDLSKVGIDKDIAQTIDRYR